MAEVCFIRESHPDTLIYYPIIKILTERKIEYSTLNIEGMSTTDILYQLSSLSSVTTFIMFGTSHNKSMIAMLCKEYGKKLIVLNGNERSGDSIDDAYSEVISATGWSHFVTEEGARRFLIEKGIRTPIGIFECPITYLSRISPTVESIDVLYISSNKEKINEHERQLIKNKYKYKIFDLTEGLPDNWKEIYSHIKSTNYVVSDLFVFDKPSRYMGKHFFYFGVDVLDTANLGISTHIMSKKLELHDYIKQSWSKLTDINKKFGLQSILNSMSS